MPGPVPGIHVFCRDNLTQNVDDRDKPGHDGRDYPRPTAFRVASRWP